MRNPEQSTKQETRIKKPRGTPRTTVQKSSDGNSELRVARGSCGKAAAARPVIWLSILRFGGQYQHSKEVFYTQICSSKHAEATQLFAVTRSEIRKKGNT